MLAIGRLLGHADPETTLKYTHASQAAMNGVPIPVVSRLLGHSSVRMTLRYAHLADREIEQAAERVGQVIAELLDCEPKRGG